MLKIEQYIDRLKDRVFTIANNNIKDCQINYRDIFLSAIVENILNTNYWYKDKFRTDFINVFEIDENGKPIEESYGLMNKIAKIIEEIRERDVFTTITEPVYKKLWGISYAEDIENY